MFFKGRSCAVCKTKFSENDDIVACPVCGAAHHRDCWNKENSCGLAHKHGTPEQYSVYDEIPEPEIKAEYTEEGNEYTELCPHCGKANPSNLLYCTQCGQALKNDADPNQANKQPFFTIYAKLFDPLGGVPADAEIDGVPVTDIAAFIGPNSRYYIPRFYSIYNGRNGGFNLAGFLFAPYWMLFRRMIGYSLIYISFVVLQLSAIMFFPEQMNLKTAGPFSPAGALYLVSFAVSAFVRIFANRLYMRHVISKIKHLKRQTTNDISYKIALQKTGGTKIENFFIFLCVILVASLTLETFFPELFSNIMNSYFLL